MQFLGTISSHMEKTIWKVWAPPKTNKKLRGLQLKTGFGRRIVWKEEVGQIVVFVHFASKQRSRFLIFLLVAALLAVYGFSLRIGWDYKACNRPLGQTSQLTNGGY